jgi:hypothetical protein
MPQVGLFSEVDSEPYLPRRCAFYEVTAGYPAEKGCSQ